MQVGWDVDNLKLLVKDGKVCESCCGVNQEYGNDCCCFMDDDTLAWSSGTTYALDALAESSGKTYKSLQNSNLNHAVSDASWWVKVSDIVDCGNANWNSYAPFGGVGKTPLYYTFSMTGIMGSYPLAQGPPLWCTDKGLYPDTTWTLTQDATDKCLWKYYLAGSFEIYLYLNSSGYTRATITDRSLGPASVIFDTYTAYASCKISSTLANGLTRACQGAGGNYGYGGTVTYYPGI